MPELPSEHMTALAHRPTVQATYPKPTVAGLVMPGMIVSLAGSELAATVTAVYLAGDNADIRGRVLLDGEDAAVAFMGTWTMPMDLHGVACL